MTERALAGASNPGISMAVACVFGLLAVVVFVVPWIPYSGAAALSTVMIVAFGLYLGLRRGEKQLDVFEVIFPYSVLYIAAFGVGTIFLLANPSFLIHPALYEYLTPALGLCVAGYLAFLGGYASLFSRVRPSPIGRLVPAGFGGILLATSLGTLGQVANGVASRRLTAGLSIDSAISAAQQVQLLFFFGWFVGWHQFWARKLTRAQATFGMPVLCGLAGLVIYSQVGGKLTTILVLVFPGLAFWYARRRLPWKSFLVILLIAVFVLFPLYNTLRTQSASLDTKTRLTRSADYITRLDAQEYARRSVYAFLERIALTPSVAAILRYTGKWVDYRYGQTILLAPIGLLIPRFIWPDKPYIAIGREVGTTFDLVNPLDRLTQIAVTSVGELYWNFHVPGVILGMFLLGGVNRLLYRRYGTASRDAPLRTAVYATALPLVLQFDGNLAAVYGTALRGIVLMVVFVVVAKHFGLFVPAEDAARS